MGFIVANLTLPGGGAVLQARYDREVDQGEEVGRQNYASRPAESNKVRLRLSAIAHNLGILWRRWVRMANSSVTSLQQPLVKTGGRLLEHARYYWLLHGDSHLMRRLFAAMVGRIESSGG